MGRSPCNRYTAKIERLTIYLETQPTEENCYIYIYIYIRTCLYTDVGLYVGAYQNAHGFMEDMYFFLMFD